ncbi:transcriptional regulator [Aspergillus heteromorphus CBS 117.55]|uniref:Transcriptional regulator n=1 Tax=Aspergillus heteromorphus CBS 117.55 TaxID=1448321 RepID=A0A317VL53_9EURO|nr:transcriptional regulator [Aspergillus heteromorphus CBS 117.55]PWY75124.1 transcriptional regulator [Aspergillus heteromorphus CBS 117.55]
MASFSSCFPRIGEKVSSWGYSFTWTSDHLSKEEIEPLRQQYDTTAATALQRLQAIRIALVEESKAKGTSPPPNDLYVLLRDHRGDDDVLTEFWTEVNTVPAWVDWEQLARGQRFFYRYAIANMVGFALQGFVAENSAAPGVIEVLVRTGGFSTRMLLGRLLETFQWLIQVTHCIDSIRPGGEGHIASVRVRLLHASVRQRILQLCQTRPEYFDTERFGVPVNILDSVHSISTFCCNPMWLQLPRFGIQPTPDEVRDYIALFRYLAFLLGTPTSYFETVEKGKRTMESLLVHELRTTDTSRTVAFNFVECVTNLPTPFQISKAFIEAGSRWINGDELCDELELGKPGALAYLSFSGHCILVTVIAWLQWILPVLDDLLIRTFRALMYGGIVQRKSRTRFEFKYVPQTGKRTGKEAYYADDLAAVKGHLCSTLSRALGMGPFETFLFFVFVVAGGVVLSATVVFLRLCVMFMRDIGW